MIEMMQILAFGNLQVILEAICSMREATYSAMKPAAMSLSPSSMPTARGWYFGTIRSRRNHVQRRNVELPMTTTEFLGGRARRSCYSPARISLS